MITVDPARCNVTDAPLRKPDPARLVTDTTVPEVPEFGVIPVTIAGLTDRAVVVPCPDWAISRGAPPVV
jgi:hypothetical protein